MQRFRIRHHINHAGGENSANTLVSLYLILLSFFIAMQAMLGAKPAPNALIMKSLRENFSGPVIYRQDQSAADDLKSDLGHALKDISETHNGVSLKRKNNGLRGFIISFSEGFLFAPDASLLRAEKSAFIEDVEHLSSRFKLDLHVITQGPDALSQGRAAAIFQSLQTSQFEHIAFGYDQGASVSMEWRFVELEGGL